MLTSHIKFPSRCWTRKRVYPGDPRNVFSKWRPWAAAEGEEIVPYDDRAAIDPETYLFPLYLYVPDHLHCVFGALEHGTKQLQEWRAMESHLRALSHFLNNRANRDRFIATCIDNPVERAALASYHVGEVTDWKWEYMSGFLFRLRDVLGILVRRFQRAKFEKHADSGEANRMNNRVIDDVCAAIADPQLATKCEVLRCVSFAVDRQATLLEGCFCHEHLLRGPQPWDAKVRSYRKASQGCMWKGRRAVQLALGMHRGMLSSAGRASDKFLAETYARADDATRRSMTHLETSLKSAIVSRLKLKLEFWEHLPHHLLGVLGGYMQHCTMATSREIALHCIREHDDAVDNGQAHKMHRVTSFFLTRGCSLRNQLEAFGNGGAIEDYPRLLSELYSFSLVPVVSRRVESVHSGITGNLKRASFIRTPAITARIRRGDVLTALDSNDNFQQWLNSKWHTRDILRRSLSPIFAWNKLVRLTQREVIQWFYLCHADAQFRKLDTVSRRTAAWSRAVKAAQTPAALAPHYDGSKLLVQFFKSIFKVGSVWCVPARLIRGALIGEVPEPWNAQYEARRCNDDQELAHQQMSCLQIAMDVCASAQAMLADAANNGQEPIQEPLFFRILDPTPESKKLARPSHLPVSSSCVTIMALAHCGAATTTDSATLLDNGCIASLDLGTIDLLSLLRGLVCWGQCVPDTAHMTLPDLVRNELFALDALVPHKRRRHNQKQQAISSPSEVAACKYLHILTQAGSFSSGRRWVPMSDLPLALLSVNRDTVAILEKHGIVASRRNDNGDEEVAANMHEVTWRCPYAASDRGPCIGRPLFGEAAAASKLELMCLLVAEGWGWQEVSMNPVTPHGPRVFSANMIMRSKRYFQALFDAEMIFSRGITRIEHHRPDAYYSCLYHLHVDEAAELHALPGFAAMGNNHFKALLAGEPLPPVLNIPAELPIVADDDDDAPHAELALEQVVAPGVWPAIGAHAAGVFRLEALRPVHWRGYTVRHDGLMLSFLAPRASQSDQIPQPPVPRLSLSQVK